MFCRNCGNELPDNSKFCLKCGAEVSEQIKLNNESATKEVKTEYEKDTTKEQIKETLVGGAGNYLDFRFKFIFIGALLCALIFFMKHQIVPGIILFVWGIILSPMVVKRVFNKSKSKIILFILLILSVLIISVVWVEPNEQMGEPIKQNEEADEEIEEPSEALDTRNDIIALHADETAQLNSTDENGNIIEDEELLLTVRSARPYMDEDEYGMGIGEITAIDYEFENTGNADAYAGPEYLSVYADGQYVEQVYLMNPDDITNGGTISPGRILTGTIYVDFVINAYDNIEVECGNITWNVRK